MSYVLLTLHYLGTTAAVFALRLDDLICTTKVQHAACAPNGKLLLFRDDLASCDA
jgi:hypothetical protein